MLTILTSSVLIMPLLSAKNATAGMMSSLMHTVVGEMWPADNTVYWINCT